VIGMGVKVTRGKAVAVFTALERALQDERGLAEAMLTAAQPVAAAARDNIQKLTGQTADQVTAWIPEEKREAGKVRVLVGIKGPDVLGKESRSFIGRFLEFGTSKMRAFPWLRPATDAQGGASFVARLIAAWKPKLQRAA
jgi:HK97 gp10 family phage protein